MVSHYCKLPQYLLNFLFKQELDNVLKAIQMIWRLRYSDSISDGYQYPEHVLSRQPTGGKFSSSMFDLKFLAANFSGDISIFIAGGKLYWKFGGKLY